MAFEYLYQVCLRKDLSISGRRTPSHRFDVAGQAGEFDEIIDVRTPLEWAEDRVPGAVNLPVLSNEERVQVGTLYNQDRMAAR